MRLKPLISLPLAVLASACISKVELVQTPIVFDPVIGTEVRAFDMSIPFPEDKTFGVWALDSSTLSRYIDNEQVCFQDGEWAPISHPLWPTSSSLSFVAYSPYTLPMGLESGELVLEGFDVAKEGTDILFAKAASGHEYGQRDVKIPFVHALSKLDMRVKNGFGDDIELRIDKIVLKGIAMRGSFHSSKHPYWRIDESSFDDIVIFDSGRDGQFLAGPTMQFIGDVYSIIPQAVKPVVELTYSFRISDAEWIDGQKESVELQDVYWEPGRYYTYSLNLNEVKLTYTTGVGHWNERNRG